IKKAVKRVKKVKTISIIKRLADLEKKILNLEDKIKNLEIDIFKEEVYTDFKKVKDYNDLITTSKSELDMIYIEYFDLQEENITTEFEGENNG
ncbi:MAG: ABC transporter C-terminal domain-containing protein, partial [Candidatus Izemoplasma sp.]